MEFFELLLHLLLNNSRFCIGMIDSIRHFVIRTKIICNFDIRDFIVRHFVSDPFPLTLPQNHLKSWQQKIHLWPNYTQEHYLSFLFFTVEFLFEYSGMVNTGSDGSLKNEKFKSFCTIIRFPISILIIWLVNEQGCKFPFSLGSLNTLRNVLYYGTVGDCGQRHNRLLPVSWLSS